MAAREERGYNLTVLGNELKNQFQHEIEMKTYLLSWTLNLKNFFEYNLMIE